jgi:hypothetical protein
MPLYTWDKAGFDAAYNFGGESGLPAHFESRPEVRLHYVYARQWPKAQRKAQWLADALGAPLPLNTRMAWIGDAWGWTAQAFLAHGLVTLCVAETSQYILDNANLTDDAELDSNIALVGLDPASGRGLQIKNKFRKGSARASIGINLIEADVLTSGGRTSIRQTIGGNPHYVVTSDVVTSLDDTECLALHDACDAFGGQQTIVHTVKALDAIPAAPRSSFNWKLLADWKLLIPDATWMDVMTGAVL